MWRPAGRWPSPTGRGARSWPVENVVASRYLRVDAAGLGDDLSSGGRAGRMFLAPSTRAVRHRLDACRPLGGPARDRGSRPREALRRPGRRRRHRLRGRRRGGLRAARAERRWQDHHGRDPRGPAGTRRRAGDGARGRRRDRGGSAEAPDRREPPDRRALPQADGHRAHRPVRQLLSEGSPDERAHRPARAGRARGRPGRRSYRAGNANGSPSRSPWSTTRSWSSSTNPRPASTRPPGGRSGTWSAG